MNTEKLQTTTALKITEQIPDNLDFGFCCVGSEIEKVFTLVNYTKTNKSFEFSKTIFKIEPI